MTHNIASVVRMYWVTTHMAKVAYAMRRNAIPADQLSAQMRALVSVMPRLTARQYRAQCRAYAAQRRKDRSATR